MYRSLTREQICKVIEGRGAAHRVPTNFNFWTSTDRFGENENRAKQLLDKYPNDFAAFPIVTAPNYDGGDGFGLVKELPPRDETKKGLDAQIIIADMDRLEELIKFPPADFVDHSQYNAPDDGRYRVGSWWFCFFERHWSLRGMENALTDFYVYPEQTHKLYGMLTDYYIEVMKMAKKAYNLDGVFTSDDIGMQTGTFFSMEIFQEFFKPYYKRLIDAAHELGMHFWLHTCGNIEMFLDDFIEIGLDVIHPIQKYTMDERKIAEKYGDKICIWAGFDVQQTIPYGTTEDVRKEVRFMLDTYFRKEGRLIMTFGNGITEDCPIDSFEAVLDETFNYSKKLAEK